MKHRYAGTDKWYKGNTHIHTTLSDGGKSPGEAVALYRTAGYDFIAITDHWHAFHLDQDLGEIVSSSRDMLVLPGIEIDGKDELGHYYHVVALGDFEQMELSENLDSSIARLVGQNAYLILAHPYWSGNRMEDVRRYPFHALEIYNHVAAWLNGKSLALPYWDDTLRHRDDLSGIASDDAHLLPQHPGWNGGWIMVQADGLSQASILQALRAGTFYATTGPSFHRIHTEGNRITCKTTPIKQAWLVGEGYFGTRAVAAEGQLLSDFSFTIEPGSQLARSSYVRLEIEDEQGKRAWTNPL
ncbi:MAG: hypothetical protein CVV52_07990 [Spirochaetae bacterium HGW-Spirochaetae-8]|jgi:hypothetical protein|nr:MAG: hypothetical protein CVV52_07990 [Spirochaetae bacterium HGW-Spirochaetae-8]